MDADAGRCSNCRACNVMAGGEADAVPSSSTFIDPARSSHLLHAISQLYTGGLFSDVTLCAGNDEIKCHRNILAASSGFFMGMFQSQFEESLQCRIPIKEMEASTLRLVLDYIYTGKVDLSVDSVQNVLSAANLFQMIHLRDGCASFMMHHITVDNCVGVYFFARAHECHELAESARQLVNAEFEAVSHELEFLSLPVDKLVDIISDDQVGQPVLQFIMFYTRFMCLALSNTVCTYSDKEAQLSLINLYAGSDAVTGFSQKCSS